MALLFVLLTAAIFAQAGGIAELVAQRSSSVGFSYQEGIQLSFLHNCSINANEQICKCVLNHLQRKYSENEYRKIDSDLRDGIENKTFTSFILNAADECNMQFGNAIPTISEDEAKAYVDSILHLVTRKEFVEDCTPGFTNILDKKSAAKVCGCIHNNINKDPSHLVDAVIKNGYQIETNFWVVDYMMDCLPNKITPEMRRNLVKFLNEKGVSKSISECAVNSFAKEYSLQAFIKITLTNPETFSTIFKGMVSKCAME